MYIGTLPRLQILSFYLPFVQVLVTTSVIYATPVTYYNTLRRTATLVDF